jgi:hypothetical protein
MIEKLTNLKIAQKLPLSIVGCALIAALSVGVSSYFQAASTVETTTDAKFDATLADRGEAFFPATSHRLNKTWPLWQRAPRFNQRL